MARTQGVNDPGAASNLPRLLYIGDVAVADTFAGEALLYRLLQFYPPEKLAVICGVRPGMPVLPGVEYPQWSPLFPRLLTSRLAETYCLWRAWRYYRVPWRIARIAKRFRPQAILTISHVSGWLCAWQLAADLKIPFHMIAHDDLVYSSRFPRWSHAWAERRFGEAYRAAASRLCISDGMAEAYHERFGAPGVVIYPTRGLSIPDHTDVAPRTLRPVSTLTFGYGGSINSESDFQQLLTFARVAGSRGHRLLVYTPQHEHLKRLAGTAMPFVDVHGPIPSAELLRRWRDEADCLLLPQSFRAADRQLTALAFPTKWADYSAVGLPLLVWAPPGSSSVRFVHEHPGCAALVTDGDAESLGAVVDHMAASVEHRRVLAETLLRAGRDSFPPEAARQRLQDVLVSAGGSLNWRPL